MFKSYLVSGLLALGLFSWAQYHGWSLFSQNESQPASSATRNIYHK